MQWREATGKIGLPTNIHHVVNRICINKMSFAFALNSCALLHGYDLAEDLGPPGLLARKGGFRVWSWLPAARVVEWQTRQT